MDVNGKNREESLPPVLIFVEVVFLVVLIKNGCDESEVSNGAVVSL